MGISASGNTFSNQSALFAMSDGSACRVNEFRRIGHPGAVRMSVFGTEGSFEEAVGSQRFLTKSRSAEDWLDVSDLLTCRTAPAHAGGRHLARRDPPGRRAHPPGRAPAAGVRRAPQRPRRLAPVPGRRLRPLLPRGDAAAQPRVERRGLHRARHRRPRVGTPRRRAARHPLPGRATTSYTTGPTTGCFPAGPIPTATSPGTRLPTPSPRCATSSPASPYPRIPCATVSVLQARLRGGVLNAARRGALRISLPVGLVYDEAGAVVLDPDAQVRGSIAHLFATFVRTGSASATVKHFQQQDLRFPRRPRNGPYQGQVFWEPLRLWRVLRVLHNPRYAGIYCFGRTRRRKLVGGAVELRKLPREQWMVRLPDAHPGYISAEQYEANLRQLRDNARAHGAERRKSPPREGAALLQGLVICGVCGRRMTVRYRSDSGRQSTVYVCQYEGNDTASAKCQSITGTGIDRGIGEVLLQTVSPVSLEVALQVLGRVGRTHPRSRCAASAAGRAGALRSRLGAASVHGGRPGQPPGGRCAGSGVEREAARTAAGAGRTRTAPTGRSPSTQRRTTSPDTCPGDRLSASVERPEDPQRERKRILRLLIEDVTLTRGDEIVMGIRFRGGATRSMTLALAPPVWRLRRTPPAVVAQIDALRDHHTDAQIAQILNHQRGLVSGDGKRFHAGMVSGLALRYRLKSRYDRMREAGLLTSSEIADLLGVAVSTVNIWVWVSN